MPIRYEHRYYIVKVFNIFPFRSLGTSQSGVERSSNKKSDNLTLFPSYKMFLQVKFLFKSRYGPNF